MKYLIHLIFALFILSGFCPAELKAGTVSADYMDSLECGDVSEADYKSILQRDENLRMKGIDFRAAGNEPFWNLEIDIEGNIKFSLMSKVDVLFASPPPETNIEKKTILYKYPEYEIEITLKKENCSDDMSGEKGTYKTEVILKGRSYLGCGKFLVFNKDPLLMNDIGRLNDIWVLEKYKDTPVNSLVEAKNSPLLEIHLNEGRIMGKNSCNTYSGSLDVDNEMIKFGKLISTKMFCPESIEMQFMDAMHKVNKWEISGMRLLLKNGEETYLTFKKID
jgi:heat shock protein HslJ/uncharacterized membrane protein